MREAHIRLTAAGADMSNLISLKSALRWEQRTLNETLGTDKLKSYPKP